MEITTTWETIEFEKRIEIDELIKRYFQPTTLNIDPERVILRPSVNVEDYIKQKQENHQKYRDISYSLGVQRSHLKDGESFYHKDYDYIELSSKTLFKKSYGELSDDEEFKLNGFLEYLFSLVILYKEDYGSLFSSNEDFSENDYIRSLIDEIKDLYYLLIKRDNISITEILVRVKDKFGGVITNETARIPETYLEDVFDYYIQVRYQNFLHKFECSRFLTEEERSLNVPIKKDPNKIIEFDREICIKIGNQEFLGVKPSCTSKYFENLIADLEDSFSFSKKLSPMYEFLKLLVPNLNRFIQDHANEKYKKKNKYLLIFAMLRIFNLVPNKDSLSLSGIEDVKEDFIKQLLR